MKTKKNALTKLLMGLTITGLFSCAKDIQNPTSEKEEGTEVMLGAYTKLGKKLANPYSIKNMRRAAAFLTRKRNVEMPPDDGPEPIEVVPTHLYIKFLPQNWDDYDKLVTREVFVPYDYPLDVEVTVGEYGYHDPSVAVDMPTPQYASLELVTNPGQYGVPYILIDSLAIPEEELEAEPSAAKREEIIELVNISMKLTGNEKDTLKFGATARSTYRPAGRIRVWDTEFGGLTPLRGVRVEARRWFTTHHAYTDVNGNYSVNGTFKNDCNYQVVFERGEFDVRSGTFGQAKINGPKREGNWNFDIADDTDPQFYAHVFSAGVDYFDNADGLGRPWNTGGFFQPKLKIGAFPKEKDYNGIAHPLTRPLGVINVIRIYNPDRGSAETYSTTIHELGHTAHWTHYKSAFNDASQRVVESWGRVVQWVFTNRKYRALLNNANYNFFRGWQDFSIADPAELAAFQAGYTPVGVDLIDNVNQRTVNGGSTNFANDNVAGASIQQIWTALSNARTLNQWRDNIKAMGIGPADDIDTLFEFYNNL